MNVVIDIRTLMEPRLTGIGQYTEALVAELVRDTTIEWYLYYNNGKGREEPSVLSRIKNLPQVHIVHTRYPNKVFNLLLTLGLVKLDRIIEKKTGVRSFDWIFFPNLGFIAVSKKIKKMLVIHDLTFVRFPHFYSFKRLLWHRILHPKKLITEAECIIVPSESTKRDVVLLCPNKSLNIEVIPHGSSEREIVVNTVSAQKEMQIPEKFFLAVGTIEPRKNFETLVEAYIQSGLSHKGIELTIIGPRGWKDRKIAKRLSTTPGITYRGYVGEGEKNLLLSHAIALVYPSFYEGFGLPVLEAFSFGTPVITSDRSALPEVTNGSAYLVRPHMVGDLVHALRDMAFNEKMREWYRVEGKKRAEDFSWVTASGRIRELLHTNKVKI